MRLRPPQYYPAAEAAGHGRDGPHEMSSRLPAVAERGDIEFADPSVVHAPTAGPEQDVICLAVTDVALRFRTPSPRILHPFRGI